MATRQVEKHLTANSFIKKKDIVVGNFLGGVAWGLGTVIGASAIVGIIAAILKFFGWTDLITQFFPN